MFHRYALIQIFGVECPEVADLGAMGIDNCERLSGGYFYRDSASIRYQICFAWLCYAIVRNSRGPAQILSVRGAGVVWCWHVSEVVVAEFQLNHK